MAKIGKAVPTESSCMDLALERVSYCFDNFDHVMVSFSGGKDSTACLQVALQVAKEKGRLPLDVITFDEEAIPPETVEYMDRISRMDGIRFTWLCIPIQHRNACSKKHPYWYPWAPEDAHLWVRPLPEQAVTVIPGFKRGMEIPDCTPLLYPITRGTVCVIMGIRCQESMSRYRAVAVKRGDMAFLTPYTGSDWITKCYPVYDWRTGDVWVAPDKYGWDYNRAYDIMAKVGISLSDQRCAPPYGEQPIKSLWTFQVCWPQLWDKMAERVPGARTGARYSRSCLYGSITRNSTQLPSQYKTWRDYTMGCIRALEEDSRAEVSKAIKGCISTHNSRASAPLPDEIPDPLSGFCWKTISLIAVVGGDKFGRQSQKVTHKALLVRRRNGIME